MSRHEARISWPRRPRPRRQWGLGDGGAEGEPLGEGEPDGEGFGEGCDGADEGAGAAADCGSGGAGGVASDSSTISTSTIAPTAADMASVSDPRDGQRPVLCAELRYARLIGVRWMPSAAAPAHGPLA